MIAVHQNVNMFIRRAMKCSEGSIWSGFAVSDYDIQICGGGTVCPNATYRQFKAAIGDPIYNGRFVRILPVRAPRSESRYFLDKSFAQVAAKVPEEPIMPNAAR